jgi:hypothetical protein
MSIMHDEENGFSLSEIFAVVCAGIVLLLIGYLLFHNPPTAKLPSSSSTIAPPTGSSSAYAVLAPATVAPKVPECTQALVFSSDGNSGPIQCSNGYLNATEWNALYTLEPSVLGLGPSATAGQVQAALCADVHANLSNPIEETSYKIASLYYGWSFSTDPSAVINNGTCVGNG